VQASGRPAQLAASVDPDVHAFWHRDPPRGSGPASALDELEVT
jgi:hypothetical protein